MYEILKQVAHRRLFMLSNGHSGYTMDEKGQKWYSFDRERIKDDTWPGYKCWLTPVSLPALSLTLGIKSLIEGQYDDTGR